MGRLIAILALLGALLGVHLWDRGVAVHSAEERVTARLNESWQKQWDLAKTKSDKAQEDLIVSHYEEVESKNAKIKIIEHQRDAALISLRDRPARTEYITDHSETGRACTGKELTREDAEFLTGEAAESDKRAVDRDFYYNEYEKVRIILENLRNK